MKSLMWYRYSNRNYLRRDIHVHVSDKHLKQNELVLIKIPRLANHSEPVGPLLVQKLASQIKKKVLPDQSINQREFASRQNQPKLFKGAQDRISNKGQICIKNQIHQTKIYIYFVSNITKSPNGPAAAKPLKIA